MAPKPELCEAVGLLGGGGDQGSLEQQGCEAHGAWVAWAGASCQISLRAALSPGVRYPRVFPPFRWEWHRLGWGPCGTWTARELGVFSGAHRISGWTQGSQAGVDTTSLMDHKLTSSPPDFLLFTEGQGSQWVGVKTGLRVREGSQPGAPHPRVTKAPSKTQVFMS